MGGVKLQSINQSIIERCVGTLAGVKIASGLMSTGVQREVVGAGERAVAVLALERLGAGVLAHVPRQLVRPSEPPVAVDERTAERLLACGHSVDIDNSVRWDALSFIP